MPTESTTPTAPVPALERVLALLGYCGLAPLLALFARRRPVPAFARHHTRQAAGIFVLLFAVILVFAVVVAMISLVIVADARLYDNNYIEAFALNTSRRLFLCWLVFWVFGVGLALLGSERRLPLACWLGDRRGLRWGVWGVLLSVYAVCSVASPFVVHAHRLAGPADRPAPVVMLFEDNDLFPRWVFTAWFYPVTRAAREVYGPDSAQVTRLTEASLKDALAHARFLFIGSHGGKSGLMLEGVYYPPEQLAGVHASPGLKFVYLAGCDSGSLRVEWEKAFAPAEVLTYDRSTAVVEHAWWLWREGPLRVRRLRQD